MQGHAVFEQIVAQVDGWGQTTTLISAQDYAQWRRQYVWQALHGQRYGQSFCNHFGIQDNHLYYAPGDVAWCDAYIRRHYIERT